MSLTRVNLSDLSSALANTIGEGGSSFDQDLNTNNDVAFNRVVITQGEINVGANNSFALYVNDGETTQSFTMGTDGTITLPGGTTLGGGPYNLEITAGSNPPASAYGSVYIYTADDNGYYSTQFAADGSISIPSAIVMDNSDNDLGMLSAGGVTVASNRSGESQYEWYFDTSGNLGLPDDGFIYPFIDDNAGLRLKDSANSDRAQLAALGAVNLRAGSAGSGKEWNFDTNGTITFPDSTTQTTAYPGFNQDLNTTDSPSFANIVANNITANNKLSAFSLVSTQSVGEEGGQIELSNPDSNTTLGGSFVTVDIWRDKFRVFEGGSARGVSIDLSKAPAGVGGELLWKVGNVVDAGTFVTLDNLKVAVAASGNRGLSVAAVSGSFFVNIGAWYGGSGGTGGNSVNNLQVTTTESGSLFGWNFLAEGNTAQYTIFDKTNSRMYRVTMMIGPAYLNNFISIERLA